MIFFCNNTGALPVEKTVDDLDEVLSEDKWNIFNKRGLHMIHLNITVSYPKLMSFVLLQRNQKLPSLG